MAETSCEAHAVKDAVCLSLRYSSIEVSGRIHTIDGVVCIWPLGFLTGHVPFHSTHSLSNSIPSVVFESAELQKHPELTPRPRRKQ